MIFNHSKQTYFEFVCLKQVHISYNKQLIYNMDIKNSIVLKNLKSN